MNDNIISSEKQEYRRRFVESNADVYEKKFGQIEAGEGRLSWNWCAFLITPLWLVYRKLFGWFFVYMALSYAFDLGYTAVLKLSELNEESGFVFYGVLCVTLAIGLYFGLNGDKFYLKRIDRCFESQDREQMAQKFGGTSVTWAMIFLLGTVAFEALRITEVPELLIQIIGFAGCSIVALVLFKREREMKTDLDPDEKSNNNCDNGGSRYE